MENVKTMYSEKGNKLLVLNNYKFSKANTSKCGKIRWKCCDCKCPARIYSNQIEEEKVIEEKGVHNHPSDPTIARQALSNSIKRKAIENICDKPSKLIHSELRTNEFSEEIHSNDIDCMRRNLYIARRKLTPALPKSQEEVVSVIEQLNPITHKEENFLLCADKHKNIVVFSCYSNLYFLCSVKTIYMDGTFEFSTKFYYQMFSIHAFKNGHYVPVLFALLPNKKTDTYISLFQIIKEKCETFDLLFNPDKIVIDFEMAIHTAVTSIWKNVNIIGCRFHLCQNWWRKVQELGLVVEFKQNDSVIGNYLKMYFGIMFLNPSDVVDMFNNELFYLLPSDQRVIKFREYIFSNYIKK